MVSQALLVELPHRLSCELKILLSFLSLLSLFIHVGRHASSCRARVCQGMLSTAA